MSEVLLMATDAARILGMSAENVRALEKSGKLPAMKTTSGRRIFKASDVERLAAEREQAKEVSAANNN